MFVTLSVHLLFCFYLGAQEMLLHRQSSLIPILKMSVCVTKWIKSCLLQCFGTFKMPILMFISVLVFRPKRQI